MSLSTRELYLILKARDEASGIVSKFGSNMSRLGALERKLNAASAASAEKLAAARRMAAEASIKADEARQVKAQMVAVKMAELDKLQMESAAKLTASKTKQAEIQMRVETLRVLKASDLAEQQSIINEQMALSAKTRSGEVIKAARIEMNAIRERMGEAIRAGQMEVLAERETRVAIAQASEARIKEAVTAVEAAKTRGDAAIAAARQEALAAKTSIAALREQSAAQLASIRSSMAAESARMSAARNRLGVGNAAMTGGVMTAAIGAVGVAALNHLANASVNYRQEVAKVATQTDKVQISMKQLEKIGLQTSNSLAVGFDQVQPTLYDIFSSIDVNAPQAGKLLRQIGHDAVGGSVDMQTAGQLNIGILNAFKLKVKDATHVSDVMFQLVRKGVGTYKQFGTTVGRAVPSAVKATQSVEDLAGMLAFLTRNGLSAAMASASAARALDAIANPTAQENFKAFGKITINVLKSLGGKDNLDTIKRLGSGFKNLSVDVTDGHGKFLPMVDIVHKMSAALSGLNKVQKADVLKAMFTGAGGTIQAMRFFNHAVNDSNNLLGEMTTDMYNAGGAAAQAYKIMSNTPAAKIQIMKNQFKALEVEIGDDLIPVKEKLVAILSKIVDWFSKLSPKTKQMIATFLEYAAATTVVIGVLVILIGLFLTLEAGITLVLGSLLPAIAAFAEFAIAAVAIYEIIKHWSQFKDEAEKIWHSVSQMFAPIEKAWKELEPVLVAGVDRIVYAFGQMVDKIAGKKKDLGTIFQDIGKFIATLMGLVKTAWPIISNTISGALYAIVPVVKIVIAIFKVLGDMWNGMPHWAQQVVVAGALIAFAMRASIASSGLWAASIGRATGAIGTSFRNSAAAGKGLQIAFLSMGLGAIMGNYAGQVSGAAGKIMGTLGGLSTGALAGFAVGGPWGAAIGGLVGGITGLVTAWGKQKDAAAESSKAAQAALQDEQDVAAGLLSVLKSVNGQYNLQARQQVIQELTDPKRGNILGAAQKAGLDPYKVVNDAMQGTGYFNKQIQDNMSKFAQSVSPDQLAKLRQGWDDVTSGVALTEKQYELWLAAQGKAIVSAKDLSGGLKNLGKEFGNTGNRQLSTAAVKLPTAPTENNFTPGKNIPGLGKFSDLQAAMSAYATLQQKNLAQTSVYAQRNAAVIKDNIKHWQDLALAQVKSGQGALSVAAGYEANITALKKQLIQMGFNKKAVNDLFATEAKMPKSITTEMKIQTLSGKMNIADLQKKIDAIKQGKIPGLTANNAAGRAVLAQLQREINILRQKNPPVIRVKDNASTQLAIIQSAINELTRNPHYIDMYEKTVILPKIDRSGNNNSSGTGEHSGPGYKNNIAFGNGISNKPIFGGLPAPKDIRNARLMAKLFNPPKGGFSPTRTISKTAVNDLEKAAALAKAINAGVKHTSVTTTKTLKSGKPGTPHTVNDYLFNGHHYSTEKAVQNAIAAAKKQEATLKKSAKTAMADAMRSARQEVSGSKAPDFLQSLFGTQKTLDRSANSLLSYVHKFMTRAQMTALRGQKSILDADSKQLASYNKQITAAQTKLSNLKSNRANLKSTVASAITGTFDVGTDQGSFTDMSNDLQQSLKDAQTFQADIKKLSAKGYSAKMIAQLYSEGPAALPEIQELLSATAPQAKAFQKNWDDLNAIASKTGDQVAGNMYDVGIKTAQGILAGLQKERKSLMKEMRDLADAMVNEIKKRLGIKSPSRVFEFVGKMNMKGLSNGHDKGFKFVKQGIRAHVSDLTNSLQKANSSMASPSVVNSRIAQQSAAQEGNVTKHFDQKFYITTQEIDPEKHAADLGWAMSRRVS